MNDSRTRSSLSQYVLILIALVLLGGVGIARFTVSDIRLGEASPVSDALSVDERTYYEYVAPRLDRLIVEVDQVVILVDERSRDIIALSVHGERIEALTNEINEFADSIGIPDRFAGVHRLIVSGTETATYTFDEARQALRTFDFSHMTALVPQFNRAADTLHNAQTEMQAVTSTPGTGWATRVPITIDIEQHMF